MSLKEKLAAIKREKIYLDATPGEPSPRQPPKEEHWEKPKPLPEVAEEIEGEVVEKPAEEKEQIPEKPEESKPGETTLGRKTIPEIAEEIRREKEGEKLLPELPPELIAEVERAEEEAAVPRKPIPAIAEEIMKQAIIETGGVREEKTGEGEPRKTIPAIAEEIRREKGIPEKPSLPEAKKGGAEEASELPPPPPPPYLTTPLPEEMVERIAEAKARAETPAPKRLYLLPPEERKKSAVEEKQVEEREFHRRPYLERGRPGAEPEVEAIVSEVYAQLKKEEEQLEPVKKKEEEEERERLKREKQEASRREFEERRKQRDLRKSAREPKKEEEPAPVVSQVSIEDILGGKAGAGEVKTTGVFGELEKQSTGGGGKNLFNQLEEASKVGAKKQAEFTEVLKEKGCPNCKAAATKIVYCPYCGGAMCATCAANIAAYPDHFTYTCPHCGEEVDVKRKAA